MAKSKVKLVANLGWMDAQDLGFVAPKEEFVAEDFAEGAVLDCTEDQAEKLVARLKCAEPLDPAKEAKARLTKSAAATA